MRLDSEDSLDKLEVILERDYDKHSLYRILAALIEYEGFRAKYEQTCLLSNMKIADWEEETYFDFSNRDEAEAKLSELLRVL